MKRVRRSKETVRSQRRDEKDEHDPFPMIPWELKTEILLKLRAKDITKLIFVSKQFSSTVLSKDFMDLFLSQSSSRPRFLCVFKRRDNRMVFHSSSQEDPSSGHHRIVSSITTPYLLAHSNKAPPPVHGLMCFQIDTRVMICNPSTGQFLTLPEIRGRTFFGYDPANGVYKVLCMTGKENVPKKVREYHVFALGAQKAWRMIKSKHSQRLLSSNEICKNGVVYYLAHTKSKKSIIGFDLGSEDFNFIKLPEGSLSLICNLVEYNGNIALYCWSRVDGPLLWVLEDANKQEWLNVYISFPSLVDLFQNFSLDFRGAISTGELIFAPTLFTNPYYIRCYDLKKNNERRVEIKGLEVCRPVRGNFGKVFLDHIESPMFLSKKLIS